jgi:hypothetical protein
MVETEPEEIAACGVCGVAVSDASLQACAICRRLCCQRCVVAGYGRIFCSVSCRDVFFFGGDDLEDVDS